MTIKKSWRDLAVEVDPSSEPRRITLWRSRSGRDEDDIIVLSAEELEFVLAALKAAGDIEESLSSQLHMEVTRLIKRDLPGVDVVPYQAGDIEPKPAKEETR